MYNYVAYIIGWVSVIHKRVSIIQSCIYSNLVIPINANNDNRDHISQWKSTIIIKL